MDPTLLIGDIVERDVSNKPVEFPAPSAFSTGFPRHKRRAKASAFKQHKAAEEPRSDTGRLHPAAGVMRQPSLEEAERRHIDQENRQKIANMTPQEIAQAQQDIINGLDPSLVQRLLHRASIDDEAGPFPFDPPAPEQHETPPPPAQVKLEDLSAPCATADPRPTAAKTIADDYDEDKAPTQIPPDLFPITDPPKSTHFPTPPTFPDLDPYDPDFLATLHNKYFPNLPADPSKLSWMAPLPSQDSPADKESPYYPHAEISVAALRFDFRGRFLSPRVSRSIPSTKGLHHHGEAPEAAGYTIAELARLARSAVPAQRCMAYQTLGRILYRLGKGEWGRTEDDPIAIGVWTSVKQGRVLESLLEAASGHGGHRGSRAYATEALWLFEKGGWRETVKGR